MRARPLAITQSHRHDNPPASSIVRHLGGDGDLDLDTSLNVDNDLLDNLGRGGKAAFMLASRRRTTELPRPRFNSRAEKTPRPGRACEAARGREYTYSIRRLWILISYESQVLEPSPLGVLRVVILRVLVGRRTGPLTRRSLFLARSRSSVETFSSDLTFREERVMRILWDF